MTRFTGQRLTAPTRAAEHIDAATEAERRQRDEDDAAPVGGVMNEKRALMRARINLAGEVLSPKKRLNALAHRCMDAMSDIVETGSPEEQTRAAGVLLAAWSKVEAKDEGDKPLTPGEREERAEKAIETKEVREWLVKQGWTPPG